jgi:hypothetical protein
MSTFWCEKMAIYLSLYIIITSEIRYPDIFYVPPGLKNTYME